MTDWLTPAQLAAELRPGENPTTATRWVAEQMARGAIPSVKVGNRRYFTPECRARLVASQLGENNPGGSWGQVTRRRAS